MSVKVWPRRNNSAPPSKPADRPKTVPETGPGPLYPLVPHNFLALPPDQSSLEAAKVALVPVPYDSTTSFRSGSRDGPEAIITASSGLEDYDFQLELDVSEI
ncbi:MAG: arginase family protein, partial [Chloroflexi bacterium]|nr:arginase family protein [Chloroflexota bacterium]